MAEAIERADRALYAAKAAGRDTWCWADAAG
jgi:PleD family two-component response regulator